MMPVAQRAALACGALVVVYCAQAINIVLVGKLAPVIAASLQRPLPALTVLFMATQSGLAVGALLGGAAGDRWGRKPVVTVCLAVAAVLTSVVPLVRSLELFALLRGCSGLMLGAAAPCVLAMVAGVVAEHWRPMAVATTLAGASMGSALGSALAFGFGTSQHWPICFWICGGGLVVALLLFSILVPDPGSPAVARRSRAATGLLGPLRTVTVVLGVGFLLSMGMNALLASWLPSFFHALAGVPVQRFAGIAMYTTPAAAVGMLLTGWLSRRLSMARLALLCFGGYAIALVCLGTTGFASGAFIAALAMTSCGQAACQATLNLTIVAHYPDTLRATALGAAAAVGRTGGILLPVFGALALVTRLPLQPLFLLLAVVPMAVGTMVWWLERHEIRTSPLRSGYTSAV